MLLIRNNRGCRRNSSEKTIRFKKNHSETKNNNRGHEGNESDKNKNRNHRNGNPNFFNKKTRDAVSHRPKVRQTKGSEKTIEATNPDREKDGL